MHTCERDRDRVTVAVAQVMSHVFCGYIARESCPDSRPPGTRAQVGPKFPKFTCASFDEKSGLLGVLAALCGTT